MVARSPVLNASRTSFIVLRIRLTEESKSARAFNNELYAWKLLRTSSSRLSERVREICVRTSWPVIANKIVTATEVESRIFASNGSLEGRREIISALQDRSRRWEPADTASRTC